MQKLNLKQTRDLIQKFEFKKLFLEMGWDNHAQTHQINIGNNNFILSSIAEKRGVQILICTQKQIPDYLTRKQIETKVTEIVYEHLIIFTDEAQTRQIWQWVARIPHKPTAYREYSYHSGQSGEVLSQKLKQISFTLDEEESLTLTNVTEKLKDSFDKEKLTKRFYEQFKKQHAAFLAFISGIPDVEMQRWYASLMINRLMFIYFIQQKGFLHHPQFPDDTHYLQQQLDAFPQRNYYRDFLTKLFFDGFAKQQHTPEIKALIGDIPYLNGSLFIYHKIEEKYGKAIEIPNAAFAKLFEFFDKWHWHLDDNPIKNDNEINPDVLGYIFEKYINQKQMGAYYTKEDITEYIGKNTILPYLFTVAQQKCKIAFQGENSIWQLLIANPNRYIYPAVRHGADLDLPPEIAAGITDVAKRTNWNQSAPAEYALPTEIWREVVARRSRYQEIYAKLANGEIHDINDFITYNLDIRQFAQDVIENAEGPELIRAFWLAIVGRVPTKSNQSFQQGLTILDPTCGSGAFLFAALEILEPLYEACLERMAAFIEDLKIAAKKKPDTNKFSDFREILAQVSEHPNRRYFILKSIIVHNLYGVDIMEEAVEIAKLRLFLKLVAQVDKDSSQKTNFGIEPLPDIDFNLRAGNTLVGFANYDEVKTTISSQLDFNNALLRIEEKASDVNLMFEEFRRQQTRLGGQVNADDKRQLRHKLAELEAELNQYLATEYGIDLTDKIAFSQWQESHKPFHWFIEFYGIIKSGGFDVIIGNPPYVEYSKVKKEYVLKGYETEKCGNLYAFVVERNQSLLHFRGKTGMIIPHSSVCTDRMGLVQKQLRKNISTWISTYCIRPSKLFFGVDQRLAIYLLHHDKKEQKTIHASCYHHWYEEYRQYLLNLLQYVDITEINFPNSLPKIQSVLERNLWNKLSNFSKLNEQLMNKGDQIVYFHNAPRYWIRAMNFIPYFWNERDGEQISTQVKKLFLKDKQDVSVVVAILNSSLFYWWFIILSDCRHLNLREIENFPIGLEKMSKTTKNELSALTEKLMLDLKQHAQRKSCFYKTTGKVVYDEFYPRLSKPIIDEIDKILAQHYGFTDEELDFIINYDIKYRMGKECK